DHMEQRMFSQLGYRKQKWGMSRNEHSSPLFILELNLGDHVWIDRCHTSDVAELWSLGDDKEELG
ncbi:hypothetical protein Tco_0035738, partial [Tanacetum coccineum]